LSKKTALLSIVTLLVLAASAAVPPQAGDRSYAAIRRDAEKAYDEKSYSRAHELYESAASLSLSVDDKRWVDYRLADTVWRADAASPDEDQTAVQQAARALEAIASAAQPDLIRAEAAESLGDFNLLHPRIHDYGQAQRWYVVALDWWAGSDDLTLARQRYLAIVFRLAGRYPWGIPRDVLVNAVKIATTPADRAHSRQLLGTHLLQEGRPESVERALELFDEVIAIGRSTEWYDDALYQAASHTRDYVKALELYRRIVAEFKPSESEWHDEATFAIADITGPTVEVFVAQTFLPGAEQEIALAWRNVKSVGLAIYPVDLTNAMAIDDLGQWVESISLAGAPARKWTYETNDDGRHEPGRHEMRLDPRVDPGAYIVTASAGGATRRALLLVTRAHIIVHSSLSSMHVFVSDVETGEPIAGATVRITPINKGAKGSVAQTNADGLAEMKVPEARGAVVITAAAGRSRQAWHQTYTQWPGAGGLRWRVYAFTDRPAYRPEETVQWKIIARVQQNEQWATPQGQSLAYEITSPRGEKVATGTAKLNAFGSFWGELALTPSMALGSYTITFRDGAYQAAAAQLFRLEEYKLPEFVVSVSTPEKTQYRLGQTIEATIDASYYFGGPVANAEVEAVVYAQPFYRYWYPWRQYPWYWPDAYPYQHESVMTRETLHTDENGRAIVRIPTSPDGQDMSYRIEARVVDASRREVRGQGSVRVTRQRYSVMAFPEHYLHRPGESVSVRFKAIDANDRPVRTTGTVRVVRRRWKEREYVEEEVTTAKVDTDAEGEATFTFTPKTVGYYSVAWTSVDGDEKRARDIVRAETTVWVADRTTTDIGYHQTGGIDIIVDKETLRAGETAAVMLVGPSSGRWVLLTSSANDILETRVVKLDGTVKLVQFPVDDRHVPNFFVTASTVFDRQFSTDNERVVVPPVEHFLTVDVETDRQQYQPRESGTVTVTTRDVDGKPVSAEVALAVSDEAVTAIQTDPAGDPRQFFYGTTREQRVYASAGLQSQRYTKLEEQVGKKERKDGSLRDELSDMPSSRMYAKVGAVAGNAMAESISVTAQSAPAPVPPPPPSAMAPGVDYDAAFVAEPPAIDVQVRADFRSTAFWKPDIVTGPNGTATVKVAFPDALTTWRATARAATAGSAFGMGSSTAKTNLPLLVRLQSPRFFVAGDRATVSGVINNNTDAAITVTPSLEVEGLTLTDANAKPVSVPAHGDTRVDWTVAAEKAGSAKLRVTARGASYGDAMEKTFVVYEHGIDKLIARSGKLRGEEAIVRLELPRERRATDLTIQVAPSLAATMLDALPYLVNFPYGCTEQTMSRFLPAAIVARTLEKLGLDPKERLPKKDLDAVTAAGMDRLYDMQHSDGGWGWWKQGDSDDFMTAYVVWGFAVAREGGLPVNGSAVDRGASWLERRLVENKEQWNELSWMLHALSAWRGKPTAAERRAFDAVWTNRERLSAYSRALFALTAHRYGETERAHVLVRNLEDGVKVDRTPDQSVLLKGETTAETMATAHWGSADRFWWRWYDSPVETTAFVLQALVTIEPEHRLVEPAMNWLVKNRRGAQWSNTRDTAISLLALNDYLEKSGELRGDVSYEITVNGSVVATKTVKAADVLRAPSRFPVDAAVLQATTQEVRIRRTAGNAPLYFSAEARFVSLEEPVTAAGNEIFVRREYFRMKPRPTLLKGVLYDKLPLRDGDSIASGERVEVVVTVDAKNDYDYLLFEDLKPAGFEAVELQSGRPLSATKAKTGQTTWVYQELRDRKVAMFVDHLGQGIWEIRYTLRAETPGQYHALPLLGQAMYVPDVRANGDEVRVRVVE